MNYNDGIIEYASTLGFLVEISFARNFPTLRGRFPDTWLAYSISMEGFKDILPSTAFASIDFLEQDLRCKYFKPALAEREQRVKKTKAPHPQTTCRLDMVGAKKLEMKFARHGLYCNISPADRWERTRIAALRIGRDPATLWGISVYDDETGSWGEIDEVYFTLRNVAGALTTFLKDNL